MKWIIFVLFLRVTIHASDVCEERIIELVKEYAHKSQTCREVEINVLVGKEEAHIFLNCGKYEI